MTDSRGSGPAAWVVALWAFLLFLVWSNSFVAIGYLLGSEGAEARFDWVGLTVARNLPVGAVCLVLCLAFWPRKTLHAVRAHWRRLFLCGLLAVPGYNLALYYGQQHGIAPPIASLETALAPLFLMIWGAWFFSERVSKRRILGFLVSVVGLGIIASAKETASGAAYPLLVGITALAPLSWSLYSVVTKPVSRDHPPILWAYLTLVFGTVPLLALAPLRGGLALYRIDAPGWTALLYLSLLCTVFGYAAWTWLVKHLPASTVGFTIFLNPPLTTISKALLAAVLPAAFAFRVVGLEWVGGAIVLIGMGLAVTGRKDGAPTAAEIYETP